MRDTSRARAVPTATPQMQTADADARPPLGQRELLTWAGETSGIYPCARLAHLGDGLVLLGLAQRLYPKRIRRDRLTARYKGKANASANWSLLLQCMCEHGIPTCMTDPEAIAGGAESECLNTLVLFHFLSRLARLEDFVVDFNFPVDARIAGFLQSSASLAAIGRSPAGHHTSREQLRSGSNSGIRAESEGRGQSDPLKSVTEKPKKRGASRLKHPFPPRTSPPSSLSSSCASAAGSDGSVLAEDAYLAAMVKKLRQTRTTRKATGEKRTNEHWNKEKRRASAAAVSRPPPSPLDEVPKGERSSSSAAATAGGSDDIHALRVDVALLREELGHEKAIRKFLEAQQRGELEVELARAAEDSAVAVASLKLHHAHEMRRLRLTLSASAEEEEMGNEKDGDEGEAAAWSEALKEANARHESFARAMRSVFAVIRAITSSGDCAEPDARTATAASQYEEAVVGSLLQQLRDHLDPTLLDALTASLQTLLRSLRQLRARSTRLQWESEHRIAVVASGDGDDRTGHAAGEGEQVLQLRRELEAARRSIATLKTTVAESHRQQQALQRAAAVAAAEAPSTRAEAPEVLRTSLRECEERLAALSLHNSINEEKAARDVQECRRMYETVTSLIARFCAMGGDVGGGGGAATADVANVKGEWVVVATALKAALRDWQEARGTLDAMEAALQEQCETIARLRRQLRVCRDEKGKGTLAATSAPLSSSTDKEAKEEEQQPQPRESSSRCPKSPPPTTFGAVPSSTGLLSPEELERRKRAILAKYTR